MAIAKRLESFLEAQSIDFELVPHEHTESSMMTAAEAHVPGDRLAKAVIVKDGDDFRMVVVPSDYHVHLGRLHRHLDREVGLATEQELEELFTDCDPGAAPPIGQAYGLKAYVERRLFEEPVVFFDSGDHEHLVRVSGDDFRRLQSAAESVEVGQHI